MNAELQEQTDTIVRSIELLRNDLGGITLALYVICALVFALFLIVALRRRPKSIKPPHDRDEQDMM